MATRQQILADLNLLSTSKLEELLSLSTFIFTPEEDQLVNVTFSQMIDKGHALADIHFPQWTDRGKSDFGEFLLELFALFSEKDFWYINAFSNEGFLQTATIYSNVYAHARNLGYSPILTQSATCKCKLTFLAGAQETFPVGSIIVSDPVTDEQFTNASPITVPAAAGATDLIVDMSQGTYRTETEEFNGKSVRITTTEIDIRSVTQSIESLGWVQVASFAQSTSSDKHFLPLPESDGSVEIAYGRNGYGLRPTLGDAVVTTYRTGGGTDGNLPAGSLTNVDESPSGFRLVTTVSQVTAGVGGQDPEDIESIRNNASLDFRTQKVIKNPSDAEIILAQYPDIHKAKAISWANALSYYLIKADGTIADQTFLTEVDARIADIGIMGWSMTGLETLYITISELTANIFVLSGFDFSIVESSVITFLESYTDPLINGEFGNGFILGEVAQEVIQNVAGVQNVVFVTVNGAAPADIVASSIEITQKIDSGIITLNVQAA